MAKIICFLLFLSMVQTGFTLKCISCDSGRNENCKDPAVVDKLAVSDCNSPVSALTTASCMKLVIEDKSTGVINITRKCMVTPKIADSCSIAKSALDALKVDMVHCSTCDTDLCNDAPKHLPTALVFLAAAYLFFRQ